MSQGKVQEKFYSSFETLEMRKIRLQKIRDYKNRLKNQLDGWNKKYEIETLEDRKNIPEMNNIEWMKKFAADSLDERKNRLRKKMEYRKKKLILKPPEEFRLYYPSVEYNPSSTTILGYLAQKILFSTIQQKKITNKTFFEFINRCLPENRKKILAILESPEVFSIPIAS
ncbi:MAG: hypothetical protein ACTSYI_00120, partial [Promethearchaeota archaeon]